MVDVLGAQLYAWSALIALLLFALFVRRVIGVRLGLPRTLLAAAVGTTLGPALVTSMLPVPPGSADTLDLLLYTALLSVVALVVAMFALATIEMLVPNGSLPGPVSTARGLRGRLRRSRRYLRILRVLAQHGLARFLRGGRHRGVATPEDRRALARSVRRAMEDAGVTFVKLGQQLGTRRDIPPEFVAELSRLQDEAHPLPWPAVEAVLAAELGAPPSQVFASIDPEPLASASVAQVHVARTTAGRDVVVKVQRPGIASQVAGDLDILDRLARTLTARTAWARHLGLTDLVAGFAAALHEELDFRVERDNLATVAAGLEASAGIVVPAAEPDLSTARVLVMERMPGIPLGAAEPVLARLGEDRRRAIAENLLHVVVDQVVVRGVFHVDLHPGNLLVADDGTLAMLDLGSVGRLGSRARTQLALLLAALSTADSVAVTDALLEVVDRPDVLDEHRLEQEVGEVLARFTGPSTVQAAQAAQAAPAMAALFQLVARYRLGIPPQVAAAFRTLATLEGTLQVVCGGYDLIDGARRYAGRSAAHATSPRELRSTLEAELLGLVPVLRRLPRRIDRITDAVEHGRLQVNVRLLADPADRRFVTRLWHQALLVVLACTAGLMAVALFLAAPGPMVTDVVGIFHVLATALLAGSVILVMRLLVVIFRGADDGPP
ncbi:AarF/UbiB family protein [Isoptericola halotolerans]|uniref:Ubiquinone biosynthesis protein n=1 Tax=Isoptericola halotolerans TaxID=300560 RepID=A0ABX2A6S3_9MICO|nr:ubiquinone biosynthesis protein [Isoptericola halotolerans]